MQKLSTLKTFSFVTSFVTPTVQWDLRNNTSCSCRSNMFDLGLMKLYKMIPSIEFLDKRFDMTDVDSVHSSNPFSSWMDSWYHSFIWYSMMSWGGTVHPVMIKWTERNWTEHPILCRYKHTWCLESRRQDGWAEIIISGIEQSSCRSRSQQRRAGSIGSF